MASNRIEYTHCLQSAIDRFKDISNKTDWSLIKSETVSGSNTSLTLWKSKDIMKAVLNEKLPFDIWDWRSIIETDGRYGWHQMVGNRQVITRLDKHTSVCRVKMKDKWEIGSRDRIVIEHVIQHTNYLRYYSVGVEQDDPLQMVCLDIQSRTNQTNQYYHVICYHQWKMETQSTIPISLFENYSLSMIKESLNILNTHGSIPFISRQDLGIDIGLNNYDSTTKTLNLEYQYQPNQSNSSDDTITNPRIKSPTIDIQRSILPPLHSRSWGQQEYLLHSSLRKNEFMSSSLRLNPSSPGSYARNTTTLSRKISFPTSNNFLSSPLLLTSDTSKKGEEIDISFDGSNASVIHLQLQLFYANGEKIGPLIINQFAQLCLRCFRHSELTSRYTLALQHPSTLIDDLNLSEDTILTIQLSLQLENKSIHLDGSNGNNNNNNNDPLIQLLLNGKQWPIRDSIPWDIAVNNNNDNNDLINDSDIDIDDDDDSHRKDSAAIQENVEEDQELDDPFMSSMEDIHELNKTKQQMNSSTMFSTRASMPNILTPSTKPSHNDTVPILKKSSSVRVNELTRSSSTTTRSPSITTTSKPTLTFLDDNDSKVNKYNLIENDKSKISNTSGSTKKLKQMTIEIKKEKNYKRPLSSGKRIVIPHADPPILTKAYQYMDTLLHSDNWQITQKPEQNNGFATIKKMDVEGHPTGALFCECAWHHCSIWDVKAVLNCSEAREIWDPMFEKGEFICSITPSCSIWHCKLKGAWPASPRDYVAFTSQYTSSQRIDICSTSCIGDTYEYYTLPKETSDYVRAKLDLSGWRLDYIDNVKKTSVSVRYVLQTHFQGWIPWYLLNQLTTQAPNVPTSAYQFFKKHGAPPSLEELELATMQQLRYDHTRKHWRLEYIRSITIGEEGPTKSTVRLDRRRWAYFSSQYNNGTDSSHYNVTIDPPPSSVVAQIRKDDPYGVWLMIEHDESFIIPIRAKILVLIKPNLPLQQFSKQKQQQQQQVPKKQRKTEVFLVVNGVSKPIEGDNNTLNEELDSLDVDKNEKSFGTSANIAPSPLISPNSSTPLSSTQISPSTSSIIISDDQLLEQYIQQLSITPMEKAQAAFIFLKRMDEQFGWTVISDKQGLRINKRNGFKVSSTKEKNESTLPLPSSSSSSSSLKDHHYLDVPEPYVIYKASKVIEKYSMEEVASVITNISDTRLVYDSSIENCTAIKSIQRGCKIIRQEIKSIFPFKSRELYMVSCLAVENIRGPPSSQRILYVESSLDIPILKSGKLPRGKMFVSGWILEPIDPYTTATNHPIPSMRATYIIALDLGTSIPSYISNMVANGIASKKIQWVERYLKEKGPLPYLTYPLPAVGLKKNKCIDIQLLDNDRKDNDKIITTTKDSIDDNVNNENNNDIHDNRRSSITQLSNTTTMASKTTMITTGTRMSTMKWRDIQTIYGQHPLLKVMCQCQYQQYKPPSMPSTPPISSSTPITIPLPSSSSPTAVPALQVQPSASQSASWIDRRHSTISYAHPISNQRRGSLPSSTLTTSSSSTSSSIVSSIITTTTATTSTLASAAVMAARHRKLEIENEKKNNNSSISYHNIANNTIIDPILVEIVVDLQSFHKGYDVMVEFYQHYEDSDLNSNNNDDNIKDLSGLLCVNVSELTPTPSYLLLATDSSNKTPPPGKHLIQIKLLSSALSQTIFQPKDKDVFNLTISLQHHQEKKKNENTDRLSDDSYINSASDRLTMSGVLGEDDDDDDNSLKETLSKYNNNHKDKKDGITTKWHGNVYVDEKKVLKYGEDIKISRIQQQDLSSLSSSNLHMSSSSPSLNNNVININDNNNNNILDHNKSLLLQQLQLKQKNDKVNMIEEGSEDNDNSSVSSCYSTSTDDETIVSRANNPHQGVFSAALGGVNEFRMRMLFPFQNSFNPSRNISSQENKTNSPIENDNSTIPNTADMRENVIKEVHGDGDENNNGVETITNDNNEIKRKRNRRRTGTFDGRNTNENDPTMSLLNMNVSSATHDNNSYNIITLSNWNVILWIIVILLCFICVVTLLLLQPRLVTFDAQSPIYSLIRLPWFKGWELHVVISKSSSLS